MGELMVVRRTDLVDGIQDAVRPIKARVEQLERLVLEARALIVERGESMEVPLQFRQHRWLRECRECFPFDRGADGD